MIVFNVSLGLLTAFLVVILFYLVRERKIIEKNNEAILKIIVPIRDYVEQWKLRDQSDIESDGP